MAIARDTDVPEPIPPANLLIFLDETGDEGYSDSRHPVFGVGGCAIISDEYGARIRRPWNRLKRDILKLADRPFHAVDFERSRPTQGQIEAINTFLTRSFYRIAVTTDINTKRPDDFDGHETVSTVIFEYVRRLIARHSARRCMVFFEHSDRGNELLERNLPLGTMNARNLFSERVEVQGYTMPKKAMEPGLELADLISHTAGKQQRKYAPDYASGIRNFTMDFRAVFHSLHPWWTLFQSVTAMEPENETQWTVEHWPAY